MMFTLPCELRDKILDYAGVDKYWKTRFSNDVLPQLNKGIRYIGGDIDHTGVLQPCANCYSYGLCDEELDAHDYYGEITYEEMISSKCDTVLIKVPWLPLEVHEWVRTGDRIIDFRKIKMELMMYVCGASDHVAYSRWWGS